MDYIDIIEKSIYNIDSKICGIIDDYRVLQEKINRFYLICGLA